MTEHLFFEACKKGDINQIKESLLNISNVNMTDDEGWTPLHYAAEHGHNDIITLLIEHGADVNLANPSGYSPYYIIMMCEHYNADIINSLYKAGASLGSELHVAILLNNEKEINKLISQMKYINSVDELGNTPLHIAVAINRNDLIIPLVTAGARVNKGDVFSTTPLHECSANGSLESLKILLSLGADPNMKDYNGRNSLIFAAGNGRTDVVKYLLNFGIEIDSQDNFGNTALHYAYENEEYLIVKILLDKNASTDIINKDGKIPSELTP